MICWRFNAGNPLYDAFPAGDRCYDRHAFACVAARGVFRRLSCPARKLEKADVFLTAGAPKSEELIMTDAQTDAFSIAGAAVLPEPAGKTKQLACDVIATPIGTMLAATDDNALHLLEFSDSRALPDKLHRLRKKTGCSICFGRLPPVDAIEKELKAYFAGETAAFHTPLALHGPAFTRRAWAALCQIPPGQTRSYAEQASHIGQPAAMRAVAQANSRNRLAIVIPCHRVIGANGSLTGYNGGGLWRKKWLIDHEKRCFGACFSTTSSL